MSDNIKKIDLPFWETLRRSFAFVGRNMDVYLKVSALWFIFLLYEIFAGFPSACNISAGGCTGGMEQKISMLLLSISSIAIAVAYSRVVILKSDINYFTLSFLKSGLKYLLFGLVIITLIAVPSFIFVFLLAYLGEIVGLPDGFFKMLILVPLLLMIFLARLYLVFPAIAVEDKNLSIKKAFKLTCGNANKIFWGQLVIMIPITFLVIALTSVYQAIASDTAILKFTFVFLIFALTFLDACLKASYYSHLYQFFTFYDNQDENVELEEK